MPRSAPSHEEAFGKRSVERRELTDLLIGRQAETFRAGKELAKQASFLREPMLDLSFWKGLRVAWSWVGVLVRGPRASDQRWYCTAIACGRAAVSGKRRRRA